MAESTDEAKSPARRRLDIKTADIVRILALVTAAFLVVRLVWLAHPVLLLIFLGVLFALPLSSAAGKLERHGVHRWISVFSILTVLVALLVGGGIVMAPILRSQSAELKEQLPEAMDKIDAWLGMHGNGLAALILTPGEATDSARATAKDSVNSAIASLPAQGAPAPIPDSSGAAAAGSSTNVTAVRVSSSSPEVLMRPNTAAHRKVVFAGSTLRREITRQFTSAQHNFLGVLRSTFGVTGGVLLVLFVAGYIGADPNLYHGLLLELVPTDKRPHAELTLRRVGTTLRQWLTMQLIAMVVIGGITTVFLFAMHVKAALPLGILAGLLHFIPIVGTFFAAVPAVAMGFIDSPHKAIMIVLGYVVIQFLENHILIPVLMKAGVNIPPALTLAVQAVMAVLFGFLGLLLAVPILAAVMTIFRTLNADEMRAVALEAASLKDTGAG